MCVGHDKANLDCGHSIFSITHRCANAVQTGNDCLRNECSFIRAEFVSPESFCMVCHQNAEKAIRDESEQNRLEITKHMDSLEEELKTPDMLEVERRFLQDMFDRTVKMLDRNYRNRESKLAELALISSEQSQNAEKAIRDESENNRLEIKKHMDSLEEELKIPDMPAEERRFVQDTFDRTVKLLDKNDRNRESKLAELAFTSSEQSKSQGA